MSLLGRYRRVAALAVVAALAAGECHPPRGDRRPSPTDTARRPADPPPDVSALIDRPLYTFDEAYLDRYLRASRTLEPDLTRRIIRLGRQNIGQPYDIYLLGEFPFELHDPDPIYCLTRSDCLTFCEHIYSMALASDWWSFLATLQRIRYRDGTIGMLTRNHYTIADWNRNNRFLFDDLTPRLGGGEAAVPLHQVCRRARFFARFGIGQDVSDETITDTYVPKDTVPSILGELRGADFVNIIRGDEAAQWAGHTGMIAIGPDGTVNLLHSARPAVREQPLVGYVNGDKRCVGIKVLRLRPDAEAIMRRTLASSPRATEVTESSLSAALARRRAALPTTARPPALDWRQALRLQSYRLGYEAPVDAGLQAALEEIDRRVGEQLGIPHSDRAFGVLDLTDLRLAMVSPDAMFYAASVPKIAILLAYFETHPEAAGGLSVEVGGELGRMIKVSDNALALKYGQRLGLGTVQSTLESKRYRFYDQEHGGGLWYGKHYGKDQPRVGDPLHDHSHGATVRQCLRFYLLLEQGRLVSSAACTRMKEIFASPQLEHIDSKFVAGLQGRDLSLIRKSGTWKDWHLDTARIQHGGRVYLLAGMVHHPRGAEYLAAAAAEIDQHLCGSAAEKPYEHQLIIHDTTAMFAAGSVRGGAVQADPPGVLLTCPPAVVAVEAAYESAVVEAERHFNEVLLSWNVDAPPHAGFCVEARVGRRHDDSWTPWLYFADWGTAVPPGERIVECAGGRIDVDYFRSDQCFDRVQYRLRAARGPLPNEHGTIDTRLRIARVTLCLSDTTGRVSAVPRPDPSPVRDAALWQRRLPVRFRSQRAERAEIAGRICSPTSVSMVLEYRGANRPTEEVARRIYDSAHDIYGNWPRAVQTAYSYGIPGYLTRFSDWAEVERSIAHDRPLIISIRADDHALTGAPYASTEGHLLVLTGFDSNGHALVNDPAGCSPELGQLTYVRRDLETVWMRTKGGTAYVLLPPHAAAEPGAPVAPRPSTTPGEPRPPVAPADEPLVELSAVDPRILIDLRYATENNFVGQRLYPTARCLLRRSAARRLRRVQDRLVRQGLGLKVFDGYRPLSVQRKMWAIVPDPRYVADPARGSRHNRGAAVDVTLIDIDGRELEMPTGYDDFTPAAHRDYTGGSERSRRNRAVLTRAMAAEGFDGLATEWWHFDAPDWEQYPIMDLPLTAENPPSSG